MNTGADQSHALARKHHQRRHHKHGVESPWIIGPFPDDCADQPERWQHTHGNCPKVRDIKAENRSETGFESDEIARNNERQETCPNDKNDGVVCDHDGVWAHVWPYP